ncbi:MAG: tRNA lysidine(34) synthetase TilS [Burkholderiales bacterium 35-55-47]|jgi:tRNA(Ile)-lysidine synthase|uniref:tRNA lysidine(34) synthetase TilS n=1 Tax=Limnohabitans sp. TaxID=1907725 RepID=UPI000BD73AE6|nr:tRNA lysidine(34) synthetase TilS [Limnohabitans sp.]OYY17466.1 MAG: tRNA lysidine(34) synthetase TilS [Burkholderiales bacterium 35-55-47]OYZ72506.1 MAG: tRNA lysidine(34) synthetase TilS [Burkholderiales bacterium 24-55-52]OZA99787.1 MAG: tRNA lysidine(34) synthetase TilS [Burkholderiales bacterium 39-55-53]HQR85225.1 tRNA lysidine(34) synthetase TilS [Limnohabitans sp.]HQS27366.1 tRNA lysidine(34) synthetase TilS [Limnohabitans sp.]
MAASPTPKLNADFPSLDALQHLGPFSVALSGGADSTALLVACATRWPGKVHAVHVHHGLQTAADDFEAHCVALCERLYVPLVVQRVNAAHAVGESPEDAARQARYRALAEALQNNWGGHIKDMALAQHADDQVETLLLALSRGAGLPGLACMPAVAERHGVTYHRPWLDVPGAALRDALRASGQAWVEDPTNEDTRYTRNRIRAELLPVIEQAFPSFRQTFARSASHAAQAQTLLQEVAEQDLQIVGNPPAIKALQQLSEARQSNVLRLWLALEHSQASAAQLQALLVQVKACTTRGHNIDIKVGRGFVRRDGAVLRCYNL